MQYKINPSDLKFLSGIIQDKKILLKLKEEDKNSGHFEIEFSDSEAEVIIETLSNVLIKSGVDEKSELNSLGNQIETLIDKFDTD